MLQRCVALLAGAGLVVTVACAQTDAGITTSVKTKLAADDTVKAYQIDVDTQNGVVTMTGIVDGQAAKEQAVTLARGTSGVRDVVDRIEVDVTSPTTGEPGALERGAGEVREDGRDAADEVGDAAGRAGTVVTDAALTTMVKSKFLADDTVRGLSIDVDTDDGVVTLNGNVRSQAEANRAAAIARETEGVKNVVSNLRIGS